jgi:hypothetical protein
VKRIALLVLTGSALLTAACGGGGEPGYCSDVDTLEQSVKDLGSVDVIAGGTNAVTDALQKVESNARVAVDAARDDFPDETGALSDSIADVKSSVRQLTDDPTGQEAARATTDVSAVVTAADDFVQATRSECD